MYIVCRNCYLMSKIRVCVSVQELSNNENQRLKWINPTAAVVVKWLCEFSYKIATLKAILVDPTMCPILWIPAGSLTFVTVNIANVLKARAPGTRNLYYFLKKKLFQGICHSQLRIYHWKSTRTNSCCETRGSKSPEILGYNCLLCTGKECNKLLAQVQIL